VSRFSHAIRFASVLLLAPGVAAPARSAAQEPPPAANASTSSPDMKPYVQAIPGTDLKFEMLPIPAGEFVMGSPPTEEKEKRGEDEGPLHPVKIAPFWMGKHEVTWDEYDQFAFSLDLKKKKRDGVDTARESEGERKADAVTRPTPPYADETFGFGRKGQPVICITHHAAMEYCRWLSEKTGKLYRLPTEAEWEYACRAGTKTAYSFGVDPAQIGDYAWYVENAEKPQPIGKKKPNPWGLYDMHGNVAEWCLDLYVPGVYKQFPTDKPVLGPVVLPTAKEYPYVARGGSWDDDADKLRSSARKASNPEWSVQDPQRPQSIWWHTDATFVGFRLVSPLNEQENLRGLKSLVVKGKTTR
jgi:formylglycine-generating enzyme required for sulfatase activity